MRTVSSENTPPTAKLCPSGLKATHHTPYECSVRVYCGDKTRPPGADTADSPDGRSQTLASPSRAAETRRRPSGLKVTLKIGPACPRKLKTARPVATSQTVTAFVSLPA